MLTREQVLKLADVVAGGEGDGGASLQDWIDTDAALRTTVEVQNHENNRLLGDLIALRAEVEGLIKELYDIKTRVVESSDSSGTPGLQDMAPVDETHIQMEYYKSCDVASQKDIADLTAQLAAMKQEWDEAVAVAKGLTEPSPLTESDKQWATETLTQIDRLKQHLATARREVWEEAAKGIERIPVVTNEQKRFMYTASDWCREQAGKEATSSPDTP